MEHVGNNETWATHELMAVNTSREMELHRQETQRVRQRQKRDYTETVSTNDTGSMVSPTF